MGNKFSKSWINMRLEYDNYSRSNILNKYLKNNKYMPDIDLIDMCSGSGNFLIWLIKNELSFNEYTLIDNDTNLLKSIKSNLRKNIPKDLKIKSNTNNMNLILCKDKFISSKVLIKKNDCDNFNYKTKRFHIISYSAALDLMSKSSIIKAIKRVNNLNAIYFSLCFNGIVKWTPTNTFDKYILSFFNKHQRTDKGFGEALGPESIDFVNRYSIKQGMKVTTKHSPWIINNKTNQDKIFMNRYLLDIKKALFHMEGIDRNILRNWYKDKKRDIEKKSIKLYVGHQDILIYKK
tara:strand:+ start:1629 stop:2501 length:873 start_codon:yes stop_codon:yes gene_type:complete